MSRFKPLNAIRKYKYDNIEQLRRDFKIHTLADVEKALY